MADADLDWSVRIVRQRSMTVGVGLAALCLLLWPTDPWVFSGIPGAVRIMAAWRIGSILITLVTVAVIALGPPRAAVPASVAACLAWTILTALCSGAIPAVHLPMLLTSSALAFMLLPLPLAPRTRALAQSAGLVGTWVAFFAMNPDQLRDPMLGLAVLVGVTFASSAYVAGNVVYQLERRNHHQQHDLAAANARAQRLLHNMLPPRVAERLQRDPVAIAESCDEVVVLFADIVGFTPRAASMPPGEVVSMLNELFSTFDRLTEAHGLEKIKTIGDAYMAAAGLPGDGPDPAVRTAELALALRDATAAYGDGTLRLRLGLHAGPAIAGVLGVTKFSYDLWGDTVNTASRMESHGEPGRVHVTAEVRERLAARYRFEGRGTQQIKGKGPMETWFLDARA